MPFKYWLTRSWSATAVAASLAQLSQPLIRRPSTSQLLIRRLQLPSQPPSFSFEDSNCHHNLLPSPHSQRPRCRHPLARAHDCTDGADDDARHRSRRARPPRTRPDPVRPAKPKAKPKPHLPSSWLKADEDCALCEAEGNPYRTRPLARAHVRLQFASRRANSCTHLHPL